MPPSTSQSTPNFWRQWLIPIVLLASSALAIFWLFYSIDFFRATAGASAGGPLDRYLRFDPDHISDAVSSLAGMTAAVFGIVSDNAGVAEWLGTGLQSRLHGFESRHSLQHRPTGLPRPGRPRSP